MTSPLLTRLREELAEGPKSREQLIRTLSPLVPPGHAWRTRALDLKRQRNRNGGKAKYEKPMETIIATGARHVVQQCIAGQIRSKKVERYFEDGVEMLRDGAVIRCRQ